MKCNSLMFSHFVCFQLVFLGYFGVDYHCFIVFYNAFLLNFLFHVLKESL